MRTTVTYLDKDNKQVNQNEAWTVVTRVYNDAGNLQRTGYTVGEAQKKAMAGSSAALVLADMDSGKQTAFSGNIVKAGRDPACGLIIDAADKKKIDKIHARFEYREQKWYITDLSKAGTLLNGEKLPAGKAGLINSGDVIDFAGRKKYTVIL